MRDTTGDAAGDVQMTVIHATPTVEVDLDGVPARCWIDTGGGVAVSDALGVDPAVPWTIGGVRLDIDIDGVEPQTWPAAEFARTGAEAFIPSRVLARHAVTFDYINGRFSLAADVAPPANAIEVQAPISSEMQFPRVEVSIDGTVHGVLLDTGASHCMMSEAVMEAWMADHPDWEVVDAALGTAAMANAGADRGRRVITVPEVRIGDAIVSNVSFVSRPIGTFEEFMTPLMTGPITGALAGSVLRHTRLDIDYRRGIVHIAPASIALPRRYAAPFNVEWHDGQSRVLDTIDDSIAVGDRLVAVDGVAISGLPFASVMEHLTRERPGVITAEVGTGGSSSTWLGSEPAQRFNGLQHLDGTGNDHSRCA